MLKKIFSASASLLCCLLAFFCVCLYLRSELSPTFFIQPFFRVVIMILACVALYFAALFTGRSFFPQRQSELIKGSLSFSFISYSVLLVNFLFFESSFSRSHSLIFLQDRDSVSAYLKDFLNLEPFGMIIRYTKGYLIGTVSFERFLMNIVGNFILFMPFAFFLPVLFRKQNNFFLFFFTVAGLSALAEILQVVFMTGTGDIDDLLLNTFGACTLFCLLRTEVGKKMVEFIRR